MGYAVAGSLLLTYDHMAPVSNIADTVNPWVFIGKYKKAMFHTNVA